MIARALGVWLAASSLPSPAPAAIDPLSGIDFVRIGAVGNPAWNGGGTADGRGSVNYEYSIGHLEVTTAQWAEFFNAAFDRPQSEWNPHIFIPFPAYWGAVATTPTVPGGRRWTVPAGNELRPVGEITWRTAAIYANWLHNGKSNAVIAFMNGAYDVSTFGGTVGNFTDQVTHHPDARYWIPTADEWIKAAHYDPNKDAGLGGYWFYSNSSDTPYIYGLPGTGATANGAFMTLTGAEYLVPLASYPTTMSPWGLLDVAGATAEWNEALYDVDRLRRLDGSAWSAGTSAAGADQVSQFYGAVTPREAHNSFGLRIASSVPSPSTGLGGFTLLWCLFARRRRSLPFSRAASARRSALFALPVLVAPLFSTPARAAIDPLSGIDFVRIGAVGNAPWTGGGNTNGRGQVNYEYNIGRFEVTTAQWVEFFNSAFDRPQSEWLPDLFVPVSPFWGAVSTTPNTPGGLRWTVPAGQEMRAVGNISWRTAAIYCNWLHNGKSSDINSFKSGAYDVSTFGWIGGVGGIFTDQETRSPGARYFIPTLDEWMKAAHYDPNKDGGQGGWWFYGNSSDNPFTYALPQDGGTSNGGVSLSGNPQYQVLLGAYGTTMSPWGLLDVSGATREWTEEIDTISTGFKFRSFDGSAWAGSTGSDRVNSSAGDAFPDSIALFNGFRIAMAVPSPTTGAGGVLALWCLCARRRSTT